MRHLSILSRTPNFLFIGPDKAGSTWLYKALRQHSQVYLPDVKELFFFDRFYEKGWTWYLKFFKDASDQHVVVGEICHDYLFSSLACRRIAVDLPGTKLMVCLREPCQRAFSQYLYMVKQGLITCDFETAIKGVRYLVDNGRYATHLRCYLESFPRNHIFVAIFDDLVENPQRFFDTICDFLDLEHIILPGQLRGKVLPAAKPRLRRVVKVARRIGWEFRQWGLPGMVGKIKASRLLSGILYRSFDPNEMPRISSQAREYLEEVFAPEVRSLDQLLGVDLTTRWGYPRSG